MKEFLTILSFSILIILLTALYYYKNKGFKYESPNQRVIRINAMADNECLQYPDEKARKCFQNYYSLIEDRD